jgi:choline dehydrogenase-like flavoprotein
MANLNTKVKDENTYDAIVVGDVKHNIDYPTTNMMPWEFKHRGEIPYEIQKENPVVSRCYAFREDAMHFFVKDNEHPYIQEKPFDWIRGYQVGGKSLLWARQTQRWSDLDFTGPARDGFAVDWPIRYADLAPWYSYVEKFVGISGNNDGLAELPDGDFLPPYELTCVEKHFKEQVARFYGNRHVIVARCAHLSKPNEIHFQQGRAQCQNRTICQRGCPFGGYFSSNSSTLPWALKTGNVTLRPNSVVHSVMYDEQKGKASGVRVVDALTKDVVEYYAPLIFVNASALNTNLILLNSTSSRFPNGLGNDNGLLGKYVAFHIYRARINATVEGFDDFITEGKRPTSAYMPRFRNLHKQETNFLRGYAVGIGAGRYDEQGRDGVGVTLKDNLAKTKWGPWRINGHIMGETIPKATNYVALDPSKDEWDMPKLRVSVDYDDNDEKMIVDFKEQMTEMFEKAGFKDIEVSDSKQAPGLDIHEMGGVRMGHDPKTSLVNKWHQLHHCKNVFVTDGACMTSTSTQNPSLTYMAFAARAVDYAAKEVAKGNL